MKMYVYSDWASLKWDPGPYGVIDFSSPSAAESGIHGGQTKMKETLVHWAGNLGKLYR